MQNSELQKNEKIIFRKKCPGVSSDLKLSPLKIISNLL